ncbi:tyrosine--tRNA ligase [Fodinicola acaciae]|uniref:tyrosine--tRNA ligase n=1 Tax=Fodinicola acaciae TaxID=2681555 RepID=UPI0013D0D24B|nr:tyrosine--tRNA ligase [Fodinicola acaciae]
MTHILDDLAWRGLIAQSTDLDALRAAMDTGPITYYVGFDPTAPSLHFGNLMQVLTARRLQLAGHRPLALVGGATGLIGDPKSTSERTLNPPEVVASWVEKIKAQIEPFLDFTGDNAATVVNNLDWTAPMSAIDFLRDIGKHFRVNKMLAKEAVAARLQSDAGINYTEFSYQILQGMDFLELYRRHGCVLQTGGSDQWGNLTAGVDLIHRVEGVSVHALATPLILKADGTKFGKTETGTVWLDPELTSPYAFYQVFVNADDVKVIDYLKTMSFRSREEIEALEEAVASRPGAREAQRALAEDLTTLLHGETACRQVIAASQALFGRGELAELDEKTLASALAEAGSVEVPDPVPTLAELLRDSGLCKGLGDARRTVAEGGAYVNNVRATDADAPPPAESLLFGSWLVLRRGRRNVAGVRVKR